MTASTLITSSPRTAEQERAREIMGKNFLGIEEASKYYGIVFSNEQRAIMSRIPFLEATLKACKDTHILVAGFPMTILEIRERAPRNPRTFYSHATAWYDKQLFAANERVRLRWYLIHKDVVAHSTSRSFDGQKALLSKNEEVPRACEFIYGILLFFLTAGERLFTNVYVRCVNSALGGDHICVGDTSGGLEISDHYYGDRGYGGMGVTSSRKPDQEIPEL